MPARVLTQQRYCTEEKIFESNTESLRASLYYIQLYFYILNCQLLPEFFMLPFT